MRCEKEKERKTSSQLASEQECVCVCVLAQSCVCMWERCTAVYVCGDKRMFDSTEYRYFCVWVCDTLNVCGLRCRHKIVLLSGNEMRRIFFAIEFVDDFKQKRTYTSNIKRIQQNRIHKAKSSITTKRANKNWREKDEVEWVNEWLWNEKRRRERSTSQFGFFGLFEMNVWKQRQN